MTKIDVKNDRLVTLAVRMADMTGRVLEETPEGGITYLHGHGDIFPKLEAALEGRFPGEGFVIKLEPEDAFGEYDAEAIRIVPVEHLGEPELVVPGLVYDAVPGEAPDGRRWRVTDVAEGQAVLEANHPLAGMALQFEIKVLEVSEPEEGDDAVGTDEVVVPSFLGLADKIVPEDDDDASDEEMDAMLAAQTDDGSSMAKLARPPRILK